MSLADAGRGVAGDRADPAKESASGPRFISEIDRYHGRDLPNAMSIDVEDYFQVSAFDHVISRDDWLKIPLRLPENINRILQLFEQEGVKATFFTLGWVAEHHPEIVRDIADAGHEIASHGYEHSRVGTFNRNQFFQDIESTRKRLEDVSGCAVRGYRAPSFSIGENTVWAHDILAEAGYTYSSSVFPIKHDHYGLPDAPRFPFNCAAGALLEIPMSSLSFGGRNWPCSGGGYFRLLPFQYSKWAIRRINTSDEMPAVFYFHPWEMDPAQPRIPGISAKTKFRHYVNLGKFEHRLKKILRAFRWDRMDRIFLDVI